MPLPTEGGLLAVLAALAVADGPTLDAYEAEELARLPRPRQKILHEILVRRREWLRA